MEFSFSDFKNSICEVIEDLKSEVISLSKKIHAHPEIAYNEYFAVEEQIALLSRHGFNVQKNLGDLPTAYQGIWGKGSNGLHVAFIAEYDALPTIGHACGHNLITGASMAAAVSLSKILQRTNIQATVSVFGTPAEENGGGKINLLEKGCFNNVDVCLMFHPGRRNVANPLSLCNLSLIAKYYGKTSHAGTSPEKGNSALNALISLFCNVNLIRLHLNSDLKIHGIISNGGEVENIIPNYAEAVFTLRAPTMEKLKELEERFQGCAKGAAVGTNTELKIEKKFFYRELNENIPLKQLFLKNAKRFGERFYSHNAGMDGYLSTDAGNLSWELPLLHPFISIFDGNNDCSLHTPEFEKASNTDLAYQKMITVGKTLGMTALDLILSKENWKCVRQAYEKNIR